MASSRTPLLADDRQRISISSDDDPEETALLGGLATSSPTRPFATHFYPSLALRGLALVLALPAFIIFIVHGPHYAGAIVFLSFAIARQLVVLVSHFGSRIVNIRIEVVHPKLKGVSTRAQEKWIKRSVAAITDGVILLGMLITLSFTAHEVDACKRYCYLPRTVTHAVILGFIAFGLLILSVPDFGSPNLLAMDIAVEKPTGGPVKLTTSILLGEQEDAEDIITEPDEYRRSRKSNPRMPVGEI
ncbi:hypothetical protein OIDMADRAFT_15995, partial [Oidiodendron maius Zn]